MKMGVRVSLTPNRGYMQIELKERSWFTKYQPKTVDDLVFDSPEFKNLVLGWIEKEEIDGNVLLYGPPGLGKTATASILIEKPIVKTPDDLLYTKKTGVEYIDEVVKPYAASRPKKSKKKIIYMEEIDRLKAEAQNALKKDTLERFQQNVSFLCCTNYIKKIDSALLTRFNYKISFSGSNFEGMTDRLEKILIAENAEYNKSELIAFVKSNYKAGMREIINQLENSFKANSGKIIFKNIGDGASIEEYVVNLVVKMLKTISATDLKNKKICIDIPDSSPVQEDYKNFVTILHNNYDINYDVIYDRLMEVSKFVPVKLICGRYADGHEFKKYPHLNLIACVYDMFKCIAEINKW